MCDPNPLRGKNAGMWAGMSSGVTTFWEPDFGFLKMFTVHFGLLNNKFCCLSHSFIPLPEIDLGQQLRLLMMRMMMMMMRGIEG